MQEETGEGLNLDFLDDKLGLNDALPPPAPQARPKRGRPPASAARTAPAKRAATKAPPYKAGMFVQPLTEMYAGIGMMLIMIDPPVGKAVVSSASQCAEALDALAKDSESVRKALSVLVTGGAWSGVIMAHTPIIMAILLTHVPAMKHIAPNLVPKDDTDDDKGE